MLATEGKIFDDRGKGLMQFNMIMEGGPRKDKLHKQHLSNAIPVWMVARLLHAALDDNEVLFLCAFFHPQG